ncbi:hypothetical protein MMC10_007213 [Thelotrema lepadinum]|nr:hypothetical protein [Thelotrema lepadinum]
MDDIYRPTLATVYDFAHLTKHNTIPWSDTASSFTYNNNIKFERKALSIHPSSSSLRPSLQSPLSLEVFASTPSNSVLAVGTQTLIIGETSSTFTSTMISLISSTTTTASGTSVSTGDHGSAPALPPATTLDRSSHADDLDSTSMITSQTLNLSDEMTTAKTGDSTVSSVDAATVESITFNTETSGKSHITSNIAFDSSSFTIAPMSDVAITRQTISPNGESTTDAPVISSATSDTAIAISTFAVSTSSTSSTSSTPGLGGIVYSMFNGEGGSTTDGPSPTTGADGSSNSTIFTGNAQRPRLPLRLGVTMIALLMLGRKFLVKIA